LDWVVDGWPKGVTEQRLTPRRCEGRNVHSASLRGEGISLAVHGGGRQACRRATDGTGRRSSNAPPRLREASPSSQLLASGCRGSGYPTGFGRRRGVACDAAQRPCRLCRRGRPTQQVRVLPARLAR